MTSGIHYNSKSGTYLNVKFMLLSQRESLVTVKFFDPQISMIIDISELPESKYAFSKKCVCVCVCYEFVRSISRNWTEVSSLSLADI